MRHEGAEARAGETILVAHIHDFYSVIRARIEESGERTRLLSGQVIQGTSGHYAL